jgi:hypothetical protein
MALNDLGEAGFLTANGSRDSHAITLADGKPNGSRKAGTPYQTITWGGIRRLMDSPTAVEKDNAPFVILSTYTEHDGRTHDVQRERGVYGGLAVDIDKGDPSIDEVINAVQAVVGDVCLEVYSSSSASADNRKWRVLVPLATPLAGSEYQETQDAFFSLLGKHGLQCDTTLARTGQPIYLPNVPEGRRDDHGRPLFYECRHVDGPALKLGPKSAIVDAVEGVREQRAKLKAEAAEAAAERAAKRARYAAAGDDTSPIEHFNENHDIGSLVLRYGFERQEGRERNHYRHTGLGNSDSYSMEDMGNHWVCLSDWAKGCKLGGTSRSGFQFGDAFDLFAYFEHGNDHKAAVRAYGLELRQRSQGTTTAAVKVTPPTSPRPANAEELAAVGVTAAAGPQPETADGGRSEFSRPSRRLVLVRASDIECTSINWLWPQRIVGDGLTIVTGPVGISKSLISVDVAARVTIGDKWPDGTGHAPQGSVILFGAEDDAGKVVVPRLAAAGADLERVHVCQGAVTADDDAGDEPAAVILERHIGELRDALDAVADCRLIVFDPLPDYIAGDENNSAEVRAALVPLARLAQERNVAVVAVLHQNKKNDLTTVQRIAGSGAFAQIARVVLSIGTHPEDADKETGKRRIMLVSKNNYGERDVGQAYEIETRSNGQPGLVWQAGLVTMDADEIARRPTGGREHEDRRNEAVDALRDLLASGEKNAATVTATLQDAGLGRRQIDHASHVLNVIKTKRPHGWCWRLPASESRDRTVPQPEPAFAAWAPDAIDQFNAT